jgi:hypothetical protein
MPLRNTIIVVVLLLLVGGYALYLRHQPAPEATPKLYKIDAKDIVKIDLHSPDRDLVLERTRDNGWKLVKPITANADSETVNEIANDIAGLQITGTAEDQPADLAPFGLAVPAVIVTVTTSDQKTLPSIMVGKQAPIGNSGFIKRADQPAVLLVGNVFAAQVNKQVNDLRSRAIFKLKAPDAHKIVIERGAETFELVRTGDNWKFTKPRDYPADKEAVTAMLNTLDNARVVEFQGDGATDLTKYGLATPSLKITLYGTGNAPGETLDFGFKQAAAGSNGTYALSGDPKTNPVYTLTNDVFAAVDKSFDDLRDKTVMRFDPAKAARITFVGGPVDETLARGADGKWSITSGRKTAAAELPVAQSLVDQLHELKATRIVEDPMSDPNHYGMVSPTVTISVMDNKGQPLGELRASILEVTVTPHSSDEKPQIRTFGYATTSLDAAVYEIPAQAVKDLENTGNRLHSDVAATPTPTMAASRASTAAPASSTIASPGVAAAP